MSSTIHISRHDDPPGTWKLSSNYYSQALRECAKEVPGMRWDSENRTGWIGYPDAIEITCKLLKARGVGYRGLREMKAEALSTSHQLPVAYKKLRDYQKTGVDFLVARGTSGALLADDLGCIDGEAIVEIYRQRKPKKIPLARLFFKFHGGRGLHDMQWKNSPTRIRSFCVDALRFNTIVDVLDKGTRPVVRLTLKSGKQLRLTPDHEVKTTLGYQRVDALVKSDVVFINKTPRCDRPGYHAVGGAIAIDMDEVENVITDGSAHVYDIVCADPYRNFVANGVIVHNCGKSVQAVRAIRAFRKKAVIVCLSQAVGVWAGNDYMESQVEKWWPLVKREGSMLRLEGTSLPLHEWRLWQVDGERARKLQRATTERLAEEVHGPTTLHRMMMSPREMGATDPYEAYEWRCSRCSLTRPLRDAKTPLVEGCTDNLPRPSTRIVVVHYDILSHWVDYLLNVWGATTAVFDELHEIVGDRANRTRAVTELARGCDVRIGLTGTPMANRPKSLYRTVDILSPGRFGEKPFVYYMRHCAGFQKQVSMTKVVYDFSGSSKEKELHRRLRYFMLRRTKAEVQQHLPPLIREIIDIKIPAKACLNVDLSVLKRSSIARQALAMSADAKLPQIIEALKADVRAGSKVVAFSHRKLVAEHIADSIRGSGMPAAVVNGDVVQKERDKRIADCKNAEGGYVLACTLDTCSTGIDLSFANIASYAELTYEPFIILQSEGRLHRHGQTRTVVCRYNIGRGSIDDLIAQAVISKLDTFETVIGNTGSTLAKDLDSMPKGRAALDALYETLRASGGA